ncbi:MAG TPA: peroxidase family protein [Candidatus Limnocylindria bacterium]|nr:peroxidase family protein [Candidatus Limnocylindria bacterium]
MRMPLITPLVEEVSERLDRRYGWDKLPLPLAVLAFIGLRSRLRSRNLFDTGLPDPPPGWSLPERFKTARTVDGRGNDLERPMMGSIGSRFGRNVPLDKTWPDDPPRLYEPNPRTVSRRLLTRERFLPATSVNVLAAAWIQFEVHDWLSHDKDEERAWEVPIADDDDWAERPMRIPATRRDQAGAGDGKTPPTYLTGDSHWWDASQIYGSSPEFNDKIRAREGGRLRIGPDGLPPADLQDGLDLSDAAGAFWIGLGVLHTVFMLEHNAIADRLRRAYPTWNDERLYDTARLVNTALMAKIHTVEWTPAVIAHPTTIYAMHANWWGLVGERWGGGKGPFRWSDLLNGIPGSATDHHGAPYSLTEEFVAVYWMHPLLPDEFTFRSVGDDHVIAELEFPDVNALHARDRLAAMSVPNVAYSLGVAHPGAITLHNYPRSLQNFHRPDGVLIDLATTELIRSRERGVPRYNEFRRQLRLRPARSFSDLTDNPEWAEQIRDVHGGDVESVDLMVGLFGEPRPTGFAFSDTAFRIFILMASRRLKSDRFFTRDYTAKVYTQEGLDWINENTMVSVLLRHYPSLAPALDGLTNAFTPWRRVA